jgi:hypothetical protein
LLILFIFYLSTQGLAYTETHQYDYCHGPRRGMQLIKKAEEQQLG